MILALDIPVVNRNSSQLETLIGCFLNTLVLRSKIKEETSFQKFLQEVRNTSLQTFVHQEIPIEKIIQEINPVRISNQPSLFHFFFNVADLRQNPFQLPGLQVELLQDLQESSLFDCSFYLRYEKTQCTTRMRIQ